MPEPPIPEQPCVGEIELLDRAAAAPVIPVTNDDDGDHESSAALSPGVATSSAAQSPPQSQLDIGSPLTSIASQDITGAAISRASHFSESVDGSTLVPSVSEQSALPSPPPSPFPCSSTESTVSSWKKWLHWRTLVPGTKTQNFLIVCGSILTVAGVVYAYKADLSQRWQNWSQFLDGCQSINFTSSSCRPYTNAELGPPPYHVVLSSKASSNTNDRRSIDILSNIRTAHYLLRSPRAPPLTVLGEKSTSSSSGLVPDASDSLNAPVNGLSTAQFMIFATLLTASSLLILMGLDRVARHRRSDRVKPPEDSMARQGYNQATTTGTAPHAMQQLRRRRRAFVPADEAIGHLRAFNDSQSSVVNHAERRASSPWSKRGSRDTDTDTSSFPSIAVYEEDVDGGEEESGDFLAKQWREWHRIVNPSCAFKTFGSNTMTLYELPTPLQSPLSEQNDSNNALKPAMSKLKQWLTPTRLNVDFHRDRDTESHAVDLRGAVAFIGAIAASPSSATIMSRCPVEIHVGDGGPEDGDIGHMARD